MSRADRYTEKDTTYCPFFRKTGACRHGDRCSRQHFVPLSACTVMIPQMWHNPTSLLLAAQRTHSQAPEICTMTAEQQQLKFEDFFAEVHTEMRKFGVIAEMQ